MTIEPLHDFVLLKQLEKETETKSGIEISQKNKNIEDRGKVLVVGPGVEKEEGILSIMTVKVGDVVLFVPHLAVPVKKDSEEYLLVRQANIIAILRYE